MLHLDSGPRLSFRNVIKYRTRTGLVARWARNLGLVSRVSKPDSAESDVSAVVAGYSSASCDYYSFYQSRLLPRFGPYEPFILSGFELPSISTLDHRADTRHQRSIRLISSIPLINEWGTLAGKKGSGKKENLSKFIHSRAPFCPWYISYIR